MKSRAGISTRKLYLRLVLLRGNYDGFLGADYPDRKVGVESLGVKNDFGRAFALLQAPPNFLAMPANHALQEAAR